MKIFPFPVQDFETDKFERVVGIIEGLAQSASNVVIFKDEPLLWFQFYLGLYLKRPTFVLIKKRDLSSEISYQLRYPLVKTTVVEKFDEKAMEKFTATISTWVKRDEGLNNK
jgi:hypothetical protein